MLKKQFLGLIFGLLAVSGLFAQPFDWYVAKAVPSDAMTKSQAEEIYAELAADDSKNVAIVEYLLKTIMPSDDYKKVISWSLADKEPRLHKILRELAALESPTASVKAANGLVNYVEIQTGFSEPVIRQRLLNNVVLLERLLVILGQNYAENVKISLFEKQQVLKGLGTTETLLKILLENGYAQDQLAFFVKHSHAQSPSTLAHPFGPVVSLHDASSNRSIYEPVAYDISKISAELQAAPGTFFSVDEYENYMNLIAREDVLLHVYLKKCQAELQGPCLKKNDREGCYIFKIHPSLNTSIVIMSETLLKQGYIIPSAITRDLCLSVQYTKDNLINRVMAIINLIAPALYQKILKIDPTGTNTVYRDDINGTGYIKLNTTGYPSIVVGRPFFNLNFDQQKFVIGHELGHYAKGDFYYNPHHQIKNINDAYKVKKSYVVKENFDKAYSRVREYEADRFSVINLGNNYLWGVAWLEKMGHPEKENNLKSTHPIYAFRLKQLQDLGQDLALGRIKLQPLTAYDWDKIIAERRLEMGLKD